VPARTQLASFAWQRPLVSFFEERTAILRDLEDAGLLRRFHVGEERVGVKVKDGVHHLIFTPEHVEVAALTQEADLDALATALGYVWKRMQPLGIRRAGADFRFITPTAGNYDSVRRKAGNHVAQWPSGIRNVDSAIAMDLAMKEPKSEIHVEFGIVEPGEAARRLVAGQPPIVEDAAIAPTIFPAKSLPDVGVYDHQMWGIADLDLEGQNGALELWSQAREKAEEIDVSISDRLLGETDEHGNGSPNA
jgi:hypothetical protein